MPSRPKHLWVYMPDTGDVSPDWGARLISIARDMGWQATPFDTAASVGPGFVFMRLPQWAPEHERARGVYAELAHRVHLGANIVLVPDRNTAMLYEDKLLQALEYAAWMPQTILATDNDGEDASLVNVAKLAEDASKALGLPLLSKARQGSASRNVRKLDTIQALETHLLQLRDEGVPVAIGHGRTAKQHGYAILQEFCQGNPYDYRVCRNGDYLTLLRRFNHSQARPFASGSGRNEPVNELTPETEAVLDAAWEFFTATGERWCGIDMVRDAQGHWRVLETTLAWSMKAYERCRYWNYSLSRCRWEITAWSGETQWQLMLIQMEDGIWSAR